MLDGNFGKPTQAAGVSSLRTARKRPGGGEVFWQFSGSLFGLIGRISTTGSVLAVFMTSAVFGFFAIP